VSCINCIALRIHNGPLEAPRITQTKLCFYQSSTHALITTTTNPQLPPSGVGTQMEMEWGRGWSYRIGIRIRQLEWQMLIMIEHFQAHVEGGDVDGVGMEMEKHLIWCDCVVTILSC